MKSEILAYINLHIYLQICQSQMHTLNLFNISKYTCFFARLLNIFLALDFSNNNVFGGFPTLTNTLLSQTRNVAYIFGENMFISPYFAYFLIFICV